MLAPAFLWWLLTDGDPASWMVGAPTVLAAAWVSWYLRAGQVGGVSPSGLLRFLPVFLWESIRGGIDVARRVLSRRMRVGPGLFDYRLRLQGQQARLLFVNAVSLVPGTLAADQDDDRLRVHVLDCGTDWSGDLGRLEVAVGRIYGEVL